MFDIIDFIIAITNFDHSFFFAASVADEVLKLDEKMENILTDAFYVLIDNEKKISEAIIKTKKGNSDDVDDIEEMGEGNRDPQRRTNQGHGIVNVTEVRYSGIKLK